MISCDAYGVQAGELSHAIEYAHADRDVGRLRVGSACLQIKTRERFEPRHRILGQRTTVIAAAALLPFPAAEPYDRVARSVAPCGARHGRLPVTGALARHGTASSRTHHRLVRYQIVRRPESSRSIWPRHCRQQRHDASSARPAPDGCVCRARDTPRATCSVSNSHTGGPHSPSPCRPPNELGRRRERSAVVHQAFVRGESALRSSVSARWRRPDRANFAQNPAGRAVASETRSMNQRHRLSRCAKTLPPRVRIDITLRSGGGRISSVLILERVRRLQKYIDRRDGG
jgi:hypothetical protein